MLRRMQRYFLTVPESTGRQTTVAVNAPFAIGTAVIACGIQMETYRFAF